MLPEVDPELERLLAEEEEIERRNSMNHRHEVVLANGAVAMIDAYRFEVDGDFVNFYTHDGKMVAAVLVDNLNVIRVYQ